MTREEIASLREGLCRILTEEQDENNRLERLKKLAKEIGAGFTRKGKVLIKQDTQGRQKYEEAEQITEGEIVLNINNALQTETMINMCRIAARNFWISMVTAMAAVLSALAAWWAIVKMMR